MSRGSSDSLGQPKVSLITVVLNGGEALVRTFESVRAQSHGSIEYIVIDGGSTDGSLDLIKRHGERIAHWVSEPDQGISDAFNKGIAAASGDYLGLLNADDWLSPDQIERAVSALEAGDADFVFGDLVYHAPSGPALHLIKGDPLYHQKIRSRMPALNHPTMLVKRTMFEAVGGFDRRFRVAMDYDWVLRAHLLGYRGVYGPDVLGHMTLAGTSDRRFVEGLAEVRKIAISHGQPAVLAWPLFAGRVVKGLGQRLVQRHMPAAFYERLRGWINPDYQTLSGDAAGPSRSGQPPL